jgi:HlyD family secretion protein
VAKVNRKVWIIGGAVVLVAALVVANIVRPKTTSSKGPEVKTEAIGTRKIEAWVRAPGKIQPVEKVQVSSNVMGRVTEIGVKEGESVAAGALLLRLDDERYRSLVQQYRAGIQSAVAQESLAAAQAREAKQNRDRAEALSARGLASEQDLQAAQTASEVADARFDAAREDVGRARAGLAQAEKDLRECVFMAPMAGVVTQLNIKVGENVVTGTMNNPGTVILTLSNLAAMEVLASVDETDVIEVEPGQPAHVLIDALPDTSFEGTVTRVGQSGRGSLGGTSQQEAANFEVAVQLATPPTQIRPGMNADVEIMTGTKDSCLAIPLQALTARPQSVVDKWKAKRERDARFGNGKEKGKKGKKDADGGSADPELAPAAIDTTGPKARNLVEGVFLMVDGHARFVPLTLGMRGETHIEVHGDIAPGQTLIVGPYKTLRTLADQDNVRPEKKGKGTKKVSVKIGGKS